MNRFLSKPLLLLCLVMQSCGGGGGGSNPTTTDTPTPLTVDVSSFLNKGATDLTNFLVPDLTQITPDGYSSFPATLAVSDFRQSGQYSAFVVGTKTVGGVTSTRGYFLQYDSAQGKWVDVSSSLFASDSDRVACSDPKQALVTKFNADGKPDVYLVCAGVGGSGVPQVAYITDGAAGKYRRYQTNFQANATSASLADINNDQYVDIVTNDGGLVFKVLGSAPNQIGTASWFSTKERILVTHTPMPSDVQNVFLIPRNGDRYLLVTGQGSGQNVASWYLGDSLGAFDSNKSRDFVLPGSQNYLVDYVEQVLGGTVYGYLYAYSQSSPATYLNVFRIEGPLANSSGPIASGNLYIYRGTPTYTTPPSWTSRVVIRSGKLVPYDAGCLNNPVSLLDQRCAQNFVQDWTNFSL